MHTLSTGLRFDPVDIDEWLASVRPQPAPAPLEGGTGPAGFLLAHAVICALRGMGVFDDRLIATMYDEAMLALETAGIADTPAHRLLDGMLKTGAAFPMREQSPFVGTIH